MLSKPFDRFIIMIMVSWKSLHCSKVINLWVINIIILVLCQIIANSIHINRVDYKTYFILDITFRYLIVRNVRKTVLFRNRVVRLIIATYLCVSLGIICSYLLCGPFAPHGFDGPNNISLNFWDSWINETFERWWKYLFQVSLRDLRLNNVKYLFWTFFILVFTFTLDDLENSRLQRIKKLSWIWI